MVNAPPGIEILAIRQQGSTRIEYEARQTALQRNVLLIALAPGILQTSPVAATFLEEARILSQLDHPNIPRLHELIQTEHDSYMVLEDVVGPGLKDFAQNGLSAPALAALAIDLCRALHHAHRQGIAHGSLSAASIIVSRQGRTKLLGFGQLPGESEHVEPIDTEGQRAVTPETSVGQPHTALSDLFSLGAVLYEAATGVAPFGSPFDIHYPTRVRNDSPTPLRKHAPHIPESFANLILQMMAKLPADRPPNALSVARELEEFVGSTTVPLLLQELQAHGFIDRTSDAPHAQPQNRPSGSFGTSLPWWIYPSAVALIGGGLGLGLLLQSQTPAPSVAPSPRALPLLAQDQALHLRVVATPWAHVVVDGLHRETTPFAHPIELEPGTHTVRLEHPQAAPEERTIVGQAGQVVLLNVEMHVKKPLPSLTAPPEREESSP